MAAFELEKLSSYDDQSLLNELKRVAAVVPHGKLTHSKFNELSKVHSTTLFNRFGNWQKALAAAGLESRFDDRTDEWSRDEIIEELQSIAKATGKSHVTCRELKERIGITLRPIIRIFGSYRAALEAAGLSQSPGGARYTDEECFENLLSVWTVLGRQPNFAEMRAPPSRIGPKAYVGRWGGWRNALRAFVERANQDVIYESPTPQNENQISEVTKPKRTPRGISKLLRYRVFSRHGNACAICGRRPDVHGTTPHVDHIIPWSKGGETVLENLRVLCSDCNLGKGANLEGS